MRNSWDGTGSVEQENWGISALEAGQAQMNLGPWRNRPALPSTLDGHTREKQTPFCLSHCTWELFVTAAQPVSLLTQQGSVNVCWWIDLALISSVVSYFGCACGTVIRSELWMCVNICKNRGHGNYKRKKTGQSLVIWLGISSLKVRFFLCEME